MTKTRRDSRLGSMQANQPSIDTIIDKINHQQQHHHFQQQAAALSMANLNHHNQLEHQLHLRAAIGAPESPSAGHLSQAQAQASLNLLHSQDPLRQLTANMMPLDPAFYAAAAAAAAAAAGISGSTGNSNTSTSTTNNLNPQQQQQQHLDPLAQHPFSLSQQQQQQQQQQMAVLQIDYFLSLALKYQQHQQQAQLQHQLQEQHERYLQHLRDTSQTAASSNLAANSATTPTTTPAASNHQFPRSPRRALPHLATHPLLSQQAETFMQNLSGSRNSNLHHQPHHLNPNPNPNHNQHHHNEESNSSSNSADSSSCLSPSQHQQQQQQHELPNNPFHGRANLASPFGSSLNGPQFNVNEAMQLMLKKQEHPPLNQHLTHNHHHHHHLKNLIKPASNNHIALYASSASTTSTTTTSATSNLTNHPKLLVAGQTQMLAKNYEPTSGSESGQQMRGLLAGASSSGSSGSQRQTGASLASSSKINVQSEQHHQHHQPITNRNLIHEQSPQLPKASLFLQHHQSNHNNNNNTSQSQAIVKQSNQGPGAGPFPWTAASRGKPRRGMMRRAVFSDNQRIGLEKRFQLQKYISKPDRKKLAEKLGLRDSQVKIWFQNRRMKWRNSKERELLSTGGSREQTLPTRNNPNPDLSDVGETAKRLAAASAANNNNNNSNHNSINLLAMNNNHNNNAEVKQEPKSLANNSLHIANLLLQCPRREPVASSNQSSLEDDAYISVENNEDGDEPASPKCDSVGCEESDRDDVEDDDDDDDELIDSQDEEDGIQLDDCDVTERGQASVS